MSQDADIVKRKQDREKYFETEGFRKWSDIMTLDDYAYGDRVEQAFIRSYIAGKLVTRSESLEPIINENKNNPDINWNAIYDYIDERMKTAPSWIKREIERIHEDMEPYRKELTMAVYATY